MSSIVLKPKKLYPIEVLNLTVAHSGLTLMMFVQHIKHHSGHMCLCPKLKIISDAAKKLPASVDTDLFKLIESPMKTTSILEVDTSVQ